MHKIWYEIANHIKINDLNYLKSRTIRFGYSEILNGLDCIRGCFRFKILL